MKYKYALCAELSRRENGRNPQRQKQQIGNIMKHQAWLLWEYSDPCSVAKSCLTLCNPMDCNMPGFPVLQCLSEFSQTYVHWVSDAIQPLILIHPLLLLPSIFHSIRVFSKPSGGQNIGASASASVLPVNIQGWSPLDWFNLLAVQGTLKGHLQHHSSKASILWYSAFLQSNSHIDTWPLEKPYLWLDGPLLAK